MTVETGKQTLEFQTEDRQLLNLMIHSLYSNKEIYLRELISNASDACDKLRFEALSDEALYQGDSDLKIRVTFDKDKRTITVSDNGIGMSRDEVIDNIGTIAKSGTRQFFEALTGDQRKDLELIGQLAPIHARQDHVGDLHDVGTPCPHKVEGPVHHNGFKDAVEDALASSDGALKVEEVL